MIQEAVQPVLSEAQARELCQRVLGQATVDGAEVRVESVVEGNARFAGNRITTAADVTDSVVTVTTRVGQRSAAVTFNTVDDDGPADAVARAEQLARIAPEDPEMMPLLSQQSPVAVSAFFDETVNLDSAARTDAVAAAIGRAEAADLVASGFLQHRARAFAVANTAGLFLYHRSSEASFTTTVRTADGQGSGWAGGSHNDWQRIAPPGELAERAVGKARGSTNAVGIEPGTYTVVLEPTAVGNLVQLLTFALDARDADEGRSFFSKRGGGNRIGERVAGERITILSDPQDPDLLEQPFTDEGLPVRRTVWVENGVLRNLAYSRYWATKQGKQPVPIGGGIKVSGGTGSVTDLVATVERGLLVTRFWYIRAVDRRTLLFTGLTRDGTFLIENGQVTRAVKNLRFNESPIAMLNNVVNMGAPVRVVASESGGLGATVVVPPIVVRGFRFTAVSDAV